jgi:hypothetical protein
MKVQRQISCQGRGSNTYAHFDSHSWLELWEYEKRGLLQIPRTNVWLATIAWDLLFHSTVRPHPRFREDESDGISIQISIQIQQTTNWSVKGWLIPCPHNVETITLQSPPQTGYYQVFNEQPAIHGFEQTWACITCSEYYLEIIEGNIDKRNVLAPIILHDCLVWEISLTTVERCFVFELGWFRRICKTNKHLLSFVKSLPFIPSSEGCGI